MRGDDLPCDASNNCEYVPIKTLISPIFDISFDGEKTGRAPVP